MKYTTLNNLTRKLKGRLNIAIEEELSIYPIEGTGQVVDNQLIELVAEQKESFVDLILEQLYELPLKQSHFIISDIVESLVISDLLLIHFQGSGGFGGLSVDMSGQGNVLKGHAMQLLSMLTAGLNLAFPGMPTQPPYPGMMYPRRLELPGETPRYNPPTQIIINNETYVGRIEENIDNDSFVREDSYYNPFSGDYDNRGGISDELGELWAE